MALNIVCLKKYTMPYSTLFWSIYTNSVCSLMYNTEILNLRESKRIYILSRHPNVKSKTALNIIWQKNIYNALFYTVLEYVHELNMLSHIKYQNSNFTRIEKSKWYLGSPHLKENGSEYSLLENVYNALFCSVF